MCLATCGCPGWSARCRNCWGAEKPTCAPRRTLSRYFRDEVLQAAEVQVMRRDDIVRLRHMLDAAREALSFVVGRERLRSGCQPAVDFGDHQRHRNHRRGSQPGHGEGRSACPDIPWQDCIVMRNRRLHGYFDIDLDVVWSTVNQELPPLIAALELLLIHVLNTNEP